MAAGAAIALIGSRGSVSSRDQATGTAPAGASVPAGQGAPTVTGGSSGTLGPAPGGVTATLVTDTSVRLTWANTRQASQVLVSMGAGANVRVFANHSPLTITGLDPARPYCFAVGYYLGTQGSATQVAWSTITTSACVRGGVPSG
jgi:hypothetical protein